MYNKVKHKDKKHFYLSSLQDLSSLNVLEKHRKVCLEINVKQSTKCLKI